MLFSQKRAKLKIALRIHWVQCYLSRKSKTKNYPVKISIKGAHCRVLFYQESLTLNIIQSKITLTVLRVFLTMSPRKSKHLPYRVYNAIFPRKSKIINRPVKNSVNGKHGTMLFSKEIVRPKLTQSKITHMLQCHFPEEQ